MNKNDKKIIVSIVLTIFIVGFIAHGYQMLNFNLIHDSITESLYLPVDWKISLGRFLQPIAWKIRGDIANPLLIGLLSFSYMSLSVYMISKIFNIRNVSLIVLLSIIFITHVSITLNLGLFINELDTFVLSIMFSICSVYFYDKTNKNNLIVSIIFIVLSLGLYQASYQVTIGLYMIYILYQFIISNTLSNILKKTIFILLVLISSPIIYYIVLNLVQSYFGIVSADSYNSVSNISYMLDFNNWSTSIFNTYKSVAKDLLLPQTQHEFFVLIINVIFFVYITLYSIKLLKSKNNIDKVLITLILLLFPFGIGIMYFMSGIRHDLMSFSSVLFYVLFIILYSNYSKEKTWNNENIIIAAAIIIFLSNTIYANKVYTNTYLAEKNAEFNITRVVEDIEDVHGYKVGITKVYFVGNFFDSITVNNSIIKHREAFGYLNKPNALTSTHSIYSYINHVLSYPMNIIFELKIEQSKLDDMPVFPYDGYIQKINDVIVVKLS